MVELYMRITHQSGLSIGTIKSCLSNTQGLGGKVLGVGVKRVRFIYINIHKDLPVRAIHRHNEIMSH
jgi:hypothetical protein